MRFFYAASVVNVCCGERVISQKDSVSENWRKGGNPLQAPCVPRRPHFCSVECNKQISCGSLLGLGETWKSSQGASWRTKKRRNLSQSLFWERNLSQPFWLRKTQSDWVFLSLTSVCDCWSELNKQTWELSKFLLCKFFGWFFFFFLGTCFKLTGLDFDTLSKYSHRWSSSDLAHREGIRHLTKWALNSCRSLSH